MNIQQELEINFVFSLLEAILLAITILSDFKLTDVFLSVFGVNLFLHLTYNGFVYPFLLNPLRTLPTPTDWFPQVRLVYDLPRGTSLLKWMRTVPNNGVIHFRDMTNQSYIMPTSHKALYDIMCGQPYSFVKSDKVRDFMSELIGRGLITVEGDTHKRQRKATNPAFSMRNIRALTDLMWEKTKLFLHEIENEMRRNPVKSSGSSLVGNVEMGRWTSRLTLDVIGTSTLSYDFATLSNPGISIVETFLGILEPTWEKITYLAIRLMVPDVLVRCLPWKLNKVMEGNRQPLRQKVLEIIRQKRHVLANSTFKPGDLGSDILSTIMQGAQFTDNSLVDQVMTLLAAGHDTTANTISWCCYELCRNPHVQDLVRKEVLAHMPSKSHPIGWEVLESLPLLNGVCEEAIRLYPTVPITFREAAADVTVAGYHIPKGTRVAIPPYAINRSVEFWGPSADQFRPDRWVSVSPTGDKAFDRTGGATSHLAMITFLHGPRTCVGKEFARIEMRCAVAALVAQYDMELQDPTKEIFLGGGLTTKPMGGMHLKLTKREW